MVKTMKIKKALAGIMLSLGLAGGIVAPASVTFATDEVAPAAEAAPAPVAAAEATPIVLVYVEIYQNEKLLLQGLKPMRVKQGEDPVVAARSLIRGEYGVFLRGEIEYLNEETAVVKLYFSTAVTTTTEEPKVTTTTTETPKTTEAPKVEEPKVQAPAPVYRLYQPDLKVHLYTKDTNEYKVLATRGWKQEGISWRTETQKGDAVYRLYHPDLKVHLYTKDTNENKVLATRGWKQEGVAYRSFGSVPVYRLYHAGIRKHLYTKDANEYKVLATRGWLQEGVAWYSQP